MTWRQRKFVFNISSLVSYLTDAALCCSHCKVKFFPPKNYISRELDQVGIISKIISFSNSSPKITKKSIPIMRIIVSSQSSPPLPSTSVLFEGTSNWTKWYCRPHKPRLFGYLWYRFWVEWYTYLTIIPSGIIILLSPSLAKLKIERISKMFEWSIDYSRILEVKFEYSGIFWLWNACMVFAWDFLLSHPSLLSFKRTIQLQYCLVGYRLLDF